MNSEVLPWVFPKTFPRLKKFILADCRRVEHKRNEILVNSSGDRAKTYYMVSGAAMLTYANEEGKLMCASFILPGATLGEFTLLSRSIRIFDIITLTRCRFMEINTSKLRDAINEDPTFKNELLGHIIARQYSAMLGFIYNNTHSITYRLIALLMGLAKYQNEEIAEGEWGEVPKISQEHLARAVNTSRNTINLHLVKLAEDGITRQDGNTLFIKYDSNFGVNPQHEFEMGSSVFK